MLQALTRVFGSRNDRLVKNYTRLVREATALEPALQGLSDEALRAKTDEFRARLKQGEKLDQLLSEAFAVVREAARRTLKMRHFDVQLVGGMALHQGKIAEMRTGEGKTLVATLNTIFYFELHVVAQIVETELVVGSVGDISGVGGAALAVVEVVDDDTDG